MSGIVRLFVGNFPPSADKDDLYHLIAKVCPVHNVYIPPRAPTGLARPFAIVEINSDMKDLRKCLQLLNNTNWKGSRLKLEVAKPYYADRLQKEKLAAEEAEQEAAASAPAPQDSEEPPAPAEVPHTLKIKKSIREMVLVGTTPADKPEPESMTKNLKYSSNSRRAIEKGKARVRRGVRCYFDDNGCRIAPAAGEDASKGEGAAPGTEAKSVVPAAPLITKPLGGGAKQRMGFGFTSLPTGGPSTEDRMACVEDPVANKWHNKSVGGLSLTDGRFQDRFKEGAAARDDYYEFAESWTAPAERVEDEDEEEEANIPFVPSVAPSEVTEEFLMEEKSRLLNALQLLSKKGGEGDAADKPPPKAAARRAPAAGETWGTAIVARYDPTAPSAESFRDNTKTAAKKLTTTGPIDFGPDDAPEAFANLSVLKDIFHAEETPSGTQDTSDDALFLETEKLALNTGATTVGEEGAAMSFNFFGGPAENSQDTSGSLAAAFGGGAASSMINEDSSNLLGFKQPYLAEYSENIAPNVPTLEDISFVDMVKEALLFHREKTEEEVHSNWLETRDKMGLAYKKKRREARKKKANVSTVVRNVTEGISRKRKPDFAAKKRGPTKRSKRL